MERLTLDLVLNTSQLQAQARSAATTLRTLEQRTEKAQAGNLDKFAAAWGKIGMRAQADEFKRQQRFADAWGKIGARAQKDKERAESKAEAARLRSETRAQRELERTRKRQERDEERAFEKAKDAVKGIGIAVGAAMVIGAYKLVDIVKSGIKAVLSDGSQFEQLKLAYKLVLGEKGGKEALSDVSRFAGQTGYDDDEIAKAMLPLFRAGLRGQAARSAYAAAEDLSAAAPGSRPEEFVDLLSKIKLKGGVSEKMLLGLGLSSEVFGNELVNGVRVRKGEKQKTAPTKTEREAAMKKAEEGKLDPQIILNAIYSAIEKRQGGQLGSGGDAFGKTMGAQLNKLQQLPSNYFKSLADSPSWPRLTAQVAKILDGLNPDGPRGQKIIAALFRAFDRLAGIVDKTLTGENIDKFASGVAMAVDNLGKLPEIVDRVIKAVELLGAVWAGSKIVGGISTLATLAPAIGTVAGSIYAMAVPLLAVGAAATSVAIAVMRIQDAAQALGGWERVKKDFLDWSSTPGYGDQGVAVAKGNPRTAQDEAENRRRIDEARNRPAVPVAASGGGKASVSIGKVENHITPPKDDTNHTGQKVAESIQKHTVDAFERAAQEGGGG